MLQLLSNDVPIVIDQNISTLQLGLLEANHIVNGLYRLSYDFPAASRETCSAEQLLGLLFCRFDGLVDSVAVSDELVHATLEYSVAALQDFQAFAVEAFHQAVEIASELVSCLVPPLLDEEPAVVGPTLQNLELVDIFLTLQFSQSQLLVHALQPFAESFEGVGAMLLARRAADAEQVVVAAQAHHRQLLSRVGRAERRVESVFGT